jgi:hypothetical protein
MMSPLTRLKTIVKDCNQTVDSIQDANQTMPYYPNRDPRGSRSNSRNLYLRLGIPKGVSGLSFAESIIWHDVDSIQPSRNFAIALIPAALGDEGDPKGFLSRDPFLGPVQFLRRATFFLQTAAL